MKIGIIGAMDEEISYLKENMISYKESIIANMSFIEGKINNKNIILAKSGIGKVNAAINASILINQYKPDCIINTGTAGGFADQLEVGDIVISDKVVHHDVDVTGFDYEYGQVPGCPKYFEAEKELIEITEKVLEDLNIQYEKGLVATGDIFMNNPANIDATKERFPEIIALEMEAAAIAQVCYQFQVPFIVIRALSDIAGKESSISFDQFINLASENAAKIILKTIKSL